MSYLVMNSENEVVEQFENKSDLKLFVEENHNQFDSQELVAFSATKVDVKTTTVVSSGDGRKRGPAQRDESGRALKKDGTPYKTRTRAKKEVSEKEVTETDSSELN